jgi:hypothetical protein
MMFGFIRSRCVCGSTRLRRSSRRTRWENLLGFLILPWRCENCDRRCYKAAQLKLIDHAMTQTARAFDRGTGASDLD